MLGPASFNPRQPFIAGQTPGSELIEVWRDGYREALAISADPVGGWVERYCTDKEGRITCMFGKGVVERVYGHVELKQTRF